jgi:hypothetical protein
MVNRSLIAVSFRHGEDGDLVVTCTCDCATTTEVHVDMPPEGRADEFAYTCDGCLSPHWMAIESRPLEDL